jgi:hypothetical protein
MRFCVISVLACVLISIPACDKKQSSVADNETQSDSVPEYFRASHGFGGGLTEMVDLSELEGFDTVRTIDDLARFASEIPDAVGFTADSRFENGTRRDAEAVLWYTNLSSPRSSWALYLFDKTKAQKSPGEAPSTVAAAAAEAKVSSKMKEAKDLIEASGPSGVKLIGDFDERKVLALAVIRLGGAFEHTGEFGVDCHSCRSVVSGGNPSRCGHGIQNKEHWDCCGATDKAGQCRYWVLIKAQDDASQWKTGVEPQDTE